MKLQWNFLFFFKLFLRCQSEAPGPSPAWLSAMWLDSVMILMAAALFVPSAEDSRHRQHSGAEEAPDGPGYLHADGRLLLHCDLLRRPLQGGQSTFCCRWSFNRTVSHSREKPNVEKQDSTSLIIIDLPVNSASCCCCVFVCAPLSFFFAGSILCFQGDVWICMELMDTSLDKFYKKVIEKGKTIQENILGKITVAVRVFRYIFPCMKTKSLCSVGVFY